MAFSDSISALALYEQAQKYKQRCVFTRDILPLMSEENNFVHCVVMATVMRFE